MPGQGILFILVGPSGAGKNTLMKPAQKHFDDLPQLPTVTTRSPRSGEQEGREHRFVSHDEFQALIQTGALIEYQNVHMDDYYGTPRQVVEEAFGADHDLIADIDCLGAEKIRAAYPHNTVLIFVSPSNLDILAERIRQRGGITPEELANRLERARFEMTSAPRCNYLIINDLVEPAVEHLRRIVLSERHYRREVPVDPDCLLKRPVFHSQAVALLQRGGKLLTRADAEGIKLPTFPVEDPTHSSHEVLQQKVQAALGREVLVEALQDERFDEVAPNHVALAAIPPGDAYLYFYHKCTFLLSDPVIPPGWEWHSPNKLKLPAMLTELLTVKTY